MKTSRFLQITVVTMLVIASTCFLVPADRPASLGHDAMPAQIPTVTIVAKRLTSEEKRAAADDDMPRVTITAKRMTPSQKLASLIAEKIELAQAHLLSHDA